MATDVPGSCRILRYGLALGLVGEVLLHEGPTGVGLALFLAACALSARTLLGPSWIPLPHAAALGFAAAAALALAVRDAPELRLALVATSGLAWGMLAARPRERSGAMARMVEGCLGLVRGGLVGAGTPVLRAARAGAGGGLGKGGLVALRGTLLALPLLALLAALFHSADAVFADWADRTVRTMTRIEGDRILLASVLAWGATGVLREVAGPPRPVTLPRVPPPSGAHREILVAVGLVDVLFLTFVASQAGYLFGGVERVAAAAGPGFAEYARRGFFELVAAAALVVPLLVAAEAAVPRTADRSRRLFRILAGVLLALVGLVLLSALHRMGMYVAAYGLTRLRVYVLAILVWLGGLMAWMVPTLLRGRPDRLVRGALVLGAGVVAALALANPDARIAQANLARVIETGEAATRPLDVGHAVALGGDAVPALLGSLDDLAPTTACALADGIVDRWGSGVERDWRSLTLAAARAVRLVHGQRRALELRLARCPASARPWTAARALRLRPGGT